MNADAAAKATAAKAVDLELRKDYDAAFHMYVKATQLYLDLAESSAHARRLATRCLTRAERLRPHALLPVWDGEPEEATFVEQAPHLPSPSLSAQQQRLGAVLAPVQIPIFLETLMGGGDLYQGSSSDCSFVTALAILCEHNVRWRTTLGYSMLYPQRNGVPCKSENDTYVVKLHVNGQARAVRLDGKVPVLNGELQCVSCRPAQLWPALLEKAYLLAKQSGYEFQGSYACTDVYMLTGWIPECIDMREPGFQNEKTWTMIFGAWERGECMLSLGTDEVGRLDLVPLHCYGILALHEHASARIVTVSNPWKGDGEPVRDMSWESVCSFFQTLQVNWNPTVFPHVQQVRGMWDASTDTSVRLGDDRSAQTVQYLLSFECAERPALIHLERDVRSDDFGDEYIAVHAFPTVSGERRMNVDAGGIMGVYVNAAHTLLPIDAREHRQFTLAVARHGKMAPMRFTLTTYATSPMALSVLHQTMPFRTVEHGTWRVPWHAAASDLWFQPQYCMTVHDHHSAPLPKMRIVLTSMFTTPVRLVVCRSQGERLVDLAGAVLVAENAAFARGIAVCHVEALQPGTYALLPCARTPVAGMDFALELESNVRVSLQLMPALGAGMYKRSVADTAPCAWRMDVPRPMRILVCAATTAPASVSHIPLHVRLTGPNLAAESHSAHNASTLVMEHMCGAGTYDLVVASHTPHPAHVDVYAMQPVTLSPHSE